MTAAKQKPTREVNELAELRRARAEIDARLDQVSADQRAATEALASARESVAELERRAANGQPVTDDERRRAERELEAAIAKHQEPWSERADGLRRAVGDADGRIREYVATNLDALLAELAGDAEAAAEAVDQACRALIAAYHERMAVEQHVTSLAAMVRAARPGDVARTKAEAVAAEANRLLEQGGEAPPVMRVDPRAPRHGQVVEQQAVHA